jgi:hypothetical protein
MRHIYLHRLHRQTSWFTAWSLAALVVIVGCNSSPTGPADSFAPTVSSTNPQNGAIGATVITASFSEAMNASTITTATFTVSSPGQAQVAGTVAYNRSTEMARFTPTSFLAPNTVYTATITTGAKDVGGNALVNNFVWSFTTSMTTNNPSLIGRPLLPPVMPS